MSVRREKNGTTELWTIDREKKLNAIDASVLDALEEGIRSVASDASVRAVVLTGAGERAFAAGADIAAMRQMTAIEAESFAERGQRIFSALSALPVPVIAAVSGFALGGGCELMMSCDMVIASETAKFGQPEINIGVMPGAGGTQRLTRAVGKVKSMEMVLTGRMISADEALRWGLINKVVPVEYYLEEAKSWAKEIASKPPVAVKLAKEAVLKSFDTTIEGGLEFERKNFYLLFASEDQKEGMKAFAEKRKPEWKGK